ncbi:MAG TPA: hypothetical protein PK129_05130 [Cellvibrionaceae bacterium]|nr:hypothetical protein [Cellvibrionaceae bacterium]
MNIVCPNCQSSNVRTLNRGKKIGGSIGVVAGTLTGMRAGACFGVPGVIIGGVSGALFGAVSGGIAGAAAGTKLGEVVDNDILDNFECTSCDFAFGLNRNSD